MKSRYGYGYSSDALEEILKDYLKKDVRMSDIVHPKYVCVEVFTPRKVDTLKSYNLGAIFVICIVKCNVNVL